MIIFDHLLADNIGTGLIGTPGLILLDLNGPTAVGTIAVAGVFMMMSSAIKRYKQRNFNLRAVLAFSLASVPVSFF